MRAGGAGDRGRGPGGLRGLSGRPARAARRGSGPGDGGAGRAAAPAGGAAHCTRTHGRSRRAWSGRPRRELKRFAGPGAGVRGAGGGLPGSAGRRAAGGDPRGRGGDRQDPPGGSSWAGRPWTGPTWCGPVASPWGRAAPGRRGRPAAAAGPRARAPEDLVDEVWLTELLRLFPSCASAIRDLPAPAELADDAGGAPVRGGPPARKRALAERARAGALVTFCDDLQSADRASLDLILQIAGPTRMARQA